jgi:hypothetical protein
MTEPVIKGRHDNRRAVISPVTVAMGCGRATAGRLRLRKCHEFETDLGASVMRQLRKPRSDKINMSREVRPYIGCRL